jgi:hypothetical protein
MAPPRKGRLSEAHGNRVRRPGFDRSLPIHPIFAVPAGIRLCFLLEAAMSDDRLLREGIRLSLDDARAMIRSHTGLYPEENLTCGVLNLCDAVTTWSSDDPRIAEARGMVQMRCTRLAQVADRFAERDLASIAIARAQAIAAIDVLQDAVLDLHRTGSSRPPSAGALLRRRSR